MIELYSDDSLCEMDLENVTEMAPEDQNKSEIDNEVCGLDLSTASEWIYPTNYPVREYQKSIVSKALFQNTLVSLPTGLGKTFIAAVVMYNFHRWYPHHNIVFMAHSKPLVAQQIDACCQIMGIPQCITAQLNGNIAAKTRKLEWESKQLFFLTPQVFNNDLNRGLVPAESIRCVVVDEAHKALGNQAFCQSIKALKPFNTNFRVLALSATPGNDMAMVKSVIENLMISHLELRTEADPDISKYLHSKKVETIVVKLDSKIMDYKNQLLKVVESYLKHLVSMKAISASFGSLSSFSLILKQKQFIANPSVGAEQRGLVLSNFSVVISLYKALEELIVHGLRSFLNKLIVLKTGEGAKNNVHTRLGKDPTFLSLVEDLEEYIGQDKDIAFDPDISMARLQDELDAQIIGGPPPVVYSHPKFVMLEQIVTQHFDDWSEKEVSTRVIVFCKSRPCTGEICNFLNRFRPLIKPMVLIGQGQASGGSTSRGLKQSAQLEVMRKFKTGQYNTLVATCVGEEGLDVGEVDLIVNFDSSRNSNTQVQRAGRTGRKRDGRVVNLVTEGKEQQDYNISISKSKNINKKISSGLKNLPLYPFSPRLLPGNINPVCQEMVLKPVDETRRNTKQREKSSADNSSPQSSATKKKPTKRVKKTKNDIVSSQSCGVKYDIRYALKKANKKSCLSFSPNRTSDSLFESVGAVDIFKAAKNKKSPSVEKHAVAEVICLDDSGDDELCAPKEIDIIKADDLPNKQSVTDFHKLKELLKKPLNNEACDLLDKLSIDELVDFVSQNPKICLPESYSLSPACNYKSWQCESDERSSSPTFFDVPLPSPCKPEKEVSSFDDWCDDALMNLSLEERKENVVEAATVLSKIDTSINQLEKSKRETLREKSGFNDSSVFKTPEKLQDVVNKIGITFPKTPESENKAMPTNRSPLEKGCETPNASMVTVTQAMSIIAGFQKNSRSENFKEKEITKAVAKIEIIHPCSPVLVPSFNASRLLNKTNLEKRDSNEKDCILKTVTNKQSESVILNDNKSSLASKLDSIRSISPMPIIPPETVETSPSLLPSYSQKKLRNTQVKKSLLFEGEIKQIPSLSNSDFIDESDEDIFANDEKERNYILTQNRFLSSSEKQIDVASLELNNESTVISPAVLGTKKPTDKETPAREIKWPSPKIQEKQLKTAVVRPLGFENFNSSSSFDSDWISLENKPKEPSLLSLKSVKSSKGVKANKSLDCFLKPQNAARPSINAQKTENIFKKSSMNNTESPKRNDKSNVSFSTFDCIPDDLAEILDVSPIKINESKTPLRSKSLLKQSTPLLEKCKRPRFQMNDDDDDDLSDGALNAIQEVEEFVKNSEVPKNENVNTSTHSNPPVFNLWSSEDSDSFIEKKPKEKKKVKAVSPKKKKKKSTNGRKKANPFIEEEAELSGGSSRVSSDEENTSGLDELDSSFLDERLNPTQAPNVDMKARYLASVKSPRIVAGGFKFPQSFKNDVPVFSQVDPNDEDYAYDSFCVADDSNLEEEELSDSELAEQLPKKRKKRKRIDSPVTRKLPTKKKKRRRIINLDSSSDEEVNIENVVPSPTPTKTLELPEKTIPQPVPTVKPPIGVVFSRNSVSVTSKTNTENSLILVGSRQIASAPEIVTALRAKYNYTVDFRSSPGADFIVGWRMGINRITLSDFCNGSPAAKNSLFESVTTLNQLFLKPIVVVEDDKEKSAPRSAGCHRDMWMKHSAQRLLQLRQSGVIVYFTQNKDETTKYIADLAKTEKDKGHGVVTEWPEINPPLETRLKFYTSLPHINIAMALRLCRKFSTLSSFLSVCDSVDAIKRELGFPQDHAVKIFHAIMSPQKT